MTDRDLEQLMREGLERRATEADVQPATALVAAARADAARGRRTPLVLGLAAASVAAVAVTGVLLGGDDDPRGSGPTVVDPATNAPMTGEWRSEYWHGLRVDVPADWGWGGAPQPDFLAEGEPAGDRVIDCGAAAYVLGTREPLLNGETSAPYVGRPIMQTDACNGTLGGGSWTPPAAPYVWLGAPVEPGTVEFDNGYVMETREVAGSTVSVATKDAALRERILDSARPGDTCEPEHVGAPQIVAVPREGIPEPTGMRVCAYLDDDGVARLAYATYVDAEAAVAFKAAVAAGAGSEGVRCRTTAAHEWVLLTVEGEGGLRQDHLVTLGECSGIELVPGGELLAVTEASVVPWAFGASRTVLVGPLPSEESRPQAWTRRYFRGMLG